MFTTPSPRSPRSHNMVPAKIDTRASIAEGRSVIQHRPPWLSPRSKQNTSSLPNSRIISPRICTRLRQDSLTTPPKSSIIPQQRPRRSGTFVATSSWDVESDTEGEDPDTEEDEIRGQTNVEDQKWFEHRWLGKHGKPTSFKEARTKMTILRRWFDSLDTDGSGEVGLDELEDPLVSVGLARCRDDVRTLIAAVDRDGTGEVTFNEFISLMDSRKNPLQRKSQLNTAARSPLHAPKHLKRPASHHQHRPQPPRIPERPSSQGGNRPETSHSEDDNANPVVKLFDDLQAGKLGDLSNSFPVLITAYRRRMLLNAHMADDPSARSLGRSVLRALERTRREAALQPIAHDDSAHSEESIDLSSFEQATREVEDTLV